MSRVYSIPLVAPGSFGVNRDDEYALMDSRWCIRATNAVLTRSGQLSARKGWAIPSGQTAIASNPDVVQLFEYLDDDGTTELIVTTATKVFKGWAVDYTDAAQDITSGTAPTAGNWQFVNFNGYALGWQASHIAIAWNGSGDFANITAATGTLPTGNAVHAAFGRVWASYADKQTIGYCALLDHTKWAGADGGGTIDMRKLWTNGMDEVVAISSLGSKLIVYGKRHIVFIGDDSGSEIGLDPSVMRVTDVIEGTGAVARDSIQSFGEGDQVYLSPHGVQSLGRVIADKNNPLASLTRNYNTQIASLIGGDDMDDVRSAHSPSEHLYMLLFPAANIVVCLDTRQFLQGEDGGPVARVTEWTFSPFPSSIVQRLNGDLLLGFNGVVGRNEGFLDNGSPYSFNYLSVWLLLDPQVESLLKIIKELHSMVQTAGNYTITYTIGFDFGTDSESFDKMLLQASTGSEFGEAEFGIDEFSGGASVLRNINIDAAGEGQYLQVGVSTDINGFPFSVQRLQLVTKLGRLATP